MGQYTKLIAVNHCNIKSLPSVVAQPQNPNTVEVQDERLDIQIHFWLQGDFEASLGYNRLCIKNNKVISVSKES